MDLKTYRLKAPAINADLAALFEKHGFKMGKLTASIDEMGGTVRYSITAADANLKDSSGAAIDADALYYANSGHYYGLKPEWLNKTFLSGGHVYTLVGLKNSKAKNKVVIIRENDTARRVGSVEWVIAAFELAEFRANAKRSA